jgi:branched-chain amino acid transport system substrate-binding protein
MHRRVKVLIALGALALVALTSAASATPSATPGVTKGSILIGGTFPLSGPASAYGVIPQAEKAYFDWFNATTKGGIFGRKVNFKFYDDGYNPAQTVQLTRQLVEQDGVFAVFNSLGTEPNLAIRDYLNQRKVPQVLVATGASNWGTQWKQFPWTIGYQPDYVGEAKIYAKFILAKVPQARIGVLMQNDAYGKDYLNGFKQGMGKLSGRIVDIEPYDVTQADVSQQMAKLKASGANVLMDFATPKFSVQAFVIAAKLGWHPTVFVNNVSATTPLMQAATQVAGVEATDGSISANYLKDPADPAQANDPGVKLFKAIMAKYYPKGNATDSFNMYGMATAWTMIKALQAAGKNPTRASLMRALLHLDYTDNPFILKGIRIQTSPTDHFPIQQGVLIRWDNGAFHNFGPIYSAK